ncbi:MAG: HAD-IA family hydrolase, partial [Anaerolineae bacterium]|nr:HAD-IA family hydrolase [Anaerolineae bacterium]
MSTEFRYSTIIFDVGGTLLGFHEREPFQEFLASVGAPASDEDTRDVHRRFVSVVVAARDSAEGLGANERPLFDWWRDIFAKTWPDRPDLAEKMYHWFRANRFDRTFADVVPALEALRGMGMPLGILSNFGTGLEELLRNRGLRDYFRFLVVSALVGMAKPDPAIFDHAVAAAGQPRSRLLYVGDHFGDDVVGARAAGLDVVLIDRADRHGDKPCPRIQSLLELPRYIGPPAPDRRAVILDMDGVVLDSMPTHLRSWQRTLAPMGIRLTAAELYPLEGMPTEPTAQRLTERFLGQACSDEEAKRLADAKRRFFLEEFEPALIPGVLPLLHDLRGRGHRLALVTGSAAVVVEQVLTPLGILDLFEV